jgi:DNA adenine methylase
MTSTSIMGYYGSKHRTADWLISLMPEHSGYVEPYAGSLSVLARKAPVKIEVANDLDDNIMTFWRVLRDRFEDLERACLLTPHSRVEHKVSMTLRPDPYDEVEHARRVWVRLAQGRAGQLRQTGWRHHQTVAGTGSGMARRLSAYVGRFADIAERLRHVSLEQKPAVEVIQAYGRDPATLLYVDPPYLGTTRSGSTNGYAIEMRDEAAHRELAEVLRSVNASVVLSGYASPLYEDLYDGWFRYERGTWTGQGNQRAARTEVTWCNRPAPTYPGSSEPVVSPTA